MKEICYVRFLKSDIDIPEYDTSQIRDILSRPVI
jgi:hypothetical protein